ncbi:MAG: M23 family metallopeptidase [Chloroflexi bacterium]|nr:M23 family metallopeptidase [Chloroflexota bacterium]
MKTSHGKAVIAFSATVIAILFFLLLGQAFAETSMPLNVKRQNVSHGSGTPTPLSGYLLPFNRKFISRITNGPGEGDHTVKSSEAIDFDPVGEWDNPFNPEYREVRAAKRGWVYINRGGYGDWGNLIILAHGDGFFTYYAHLAFREPLALGTIVRKKQKIGIVGSTGNSTGPHLHWEARDQMTPTPIPPATLASGAAYGGDSRRHSLRRVRGIGWGPWYPEVLNVVTLNSGLNISSTSHVVGACSGASQIVSRWPGADDEFNDVYNGHQITGYSYEWNTDPDFLPDATPDAYHGAYYAISPGLTLGPSGGAAIPYYFHLRIRSSGYGWASPEEVAHQGPYKLREGCSTTPPASEWQDPPSDADP